MTAIPGKSNFVSHKLNVPALLLLQQQCNSYWYYTHLGYCDNQRVPSPMNVCMLGSQMGLVCRKDDPAAWIKHQKRRWQKGIQERKRRKLEAAKAAGKPNDPSKAPKGMFAVVMCVPYVQWHTHL